MSSRISPNKNAVQPAGLTRLPNLVAVSPNDKASREPHPPSAVPMNTQFEGREVDSKSSTRTTYSTVSTQTERTRKTKT